MKSLRPGLATISLASVFGGCASTDTSNALSIMSFPISTFVAFAVEGGEDDIGKDIGSFYEVGPVFRQSLVSRVRNVPEEIRISVQGEVEDDSVKVGPKVGAFARGGLKFPLIENSMSFNTGIEGELSASLFSEIPEGSSYASYSIHTKAGPDWNSFFIPKIFAGIETRISDSISIGAGYSLWREDLIAETMHESSNHRYRNYGSNLVDMVVGGAFVSLIYHKKRGNRLFFEISYQDILDKDYTSLGREAEIEFEEFPIGLHIGGRLNF
jgi:hypothetical protein